MIRARLSKSALDVRARLEISLGRAFSRAWRWGCRLLKFGLFGLGARPLCVRLAAGCSTAECGLEADLNTFQRVFLRLGDLAAAEQAQST